MRITFTHSGDLTGTEAFLKTVQKLDIRQLIHTQAQRGVKALTSATPHDSGLASLSWGVEVSGTLDQVTITWFNRDVENGFPVAIMLQYGYGTGTGGYVSGRDYINPAMRPIFDSIAEEVWKAVKSA